VAQNAVRIMLAQGTGGCLLFNLSKQAMNPGPNYGPYGAWHITRMIRSDLHA